MNKYTQRILIANDVIQQINSKTLIARRGYYNINPFVISSITGLTGAVPVDVQKAVCGLKECEVCAKGALLIASIKRFNHVTLEEFQRANRFYEFEEAKTPLNKIFTPRQMTEMEYIFEGQKQGWNSSLRGYEYIKLNTFRDKVLEGVSMLDSYSGSDKLLIAIMEKIIDNDGRRIVL